MDCAQKCVAQVMAGNHVESLTGRVKFEDSAAIRFREIYRMSGYSAQHFVEIERRANRAADITKSAHLFERNLELAGALLQFLQQPHVFNGDNCLIGESCYEIDLSRRKGCRVRSEDDDDADRDPFPEQRYAEYRSELLQVLNSVMVFGIISNIGYVNHAALQNGSSCDRRSSDARRISYDEVI